MPQNIYKYGTNNHIFMFISTPNVSLTELAKIIGVLNASINALVPRGTGEFS